MNAILLAAILACGGGEVDVANPEDGSLLFSQNSKKVVQRHTDSSITHVAIVMHENGQCLVYEAAPPIVRRLHITRYYKEIGLLNQSLNADEDEVRVWLLPPSKPYSPEQVGAMKSYLNAQLGRRYSIKNYVREKTGDGIHCAELAGNTITQSGRHNIAASYSDNPATLLKVVTPAYRDAYEVLITVHADDEESRAEADKSWCDRAWDKWHSFRRFCAWSCYETWTFCR